MTVCLDLLSAYVAMVVAYDLRFQRAQAPWEIPAGPALLMGVSLFVLFLCMVYSGGYRVASGLSFQRQIETLARCVGVHTLVMASLLLAVDMMGGTRRFVLAASALVPFALFISRIGMHRARVLLGRRGIGIQRAVVIGGGHCASRVFKRFARAPELGYEIVGVVIDTDDPFSEKRPWEAIGCVQDLPRLAKEHQLDLVFTLDWNVSESRHRALAGICRDAGLRMRYLSEHTDMLLQKTGVHDLTGVTLVTARGGLKHKLRRLSKRSLDLAGALLLTVLVSPIAALIALAIRLDSKGPVFFRQRRIAEAGRVFDMIKFRTMEQDAESRKDYLRQQNEASGPLFKMRHDPRITRVGRILRKTSLDELPQLINVLRGDMSLVGPRPPMPAEVEKYEEWQFLRLQGKQGMTGLWQVSGRSEIDFEKMVLLDLYYLENQSILFDLEILMSTVPAVLLGRGAY